MKTIIAGSRTIKEFLHVGYALVKCGWRHEITEVVCGMSRGVDTLGRHWAENTGVAIKDFPADWSTYGKAAGPIRNEAMAEYADALILVWNGMSGGSADMLRRAKAHGLKIYEHVVESK